jgi:4-alpha-glucanotransferase
LIEAAVTEVAKRNIYSAELLAAYEDADGRIQQAPARTLGILRKLLATPDHVPGAHAVVSVGDDLDLTRFLSNDLNFSRWQLCRDGRAILSGTPASAIPIPIDLPAGEYLLNSDGGTTDPVAVLVTPREAYQPGLTTQKRTWLLAVQLYALASPENWGHGDFGDLRRILEICAQAGAGGVGLNPLHALFEHNPEDASPYAPSSRHFINPLYLELSRLPGYADADDSLAGTLRRDGHLVDYAAVAHGKYAAIETAYRRFMAEADAALAEAFSDFRRRKGSRLRRFAAFSLLQGRHGLGWRQWPDEWRKPDDTRIAELAGQAPEAIGMREFAQWQCHSQLAACRDYARQQGMAIGLYLDLAVGSHPNGFDAWDDQDAFFQGVTIGAPPDALNPAGQNWGLTAFNPVVLVRRGFRPLRDILAATMEYAGAIRILGLNRLYLIPEGTSSREGAYLSYPLRELLAVIAHESQRWHCLVIGEDLGTVPHGFRNQLQAAGIWTYIVTLFERAADGTFRDPADYPFRALATFTTHDLPPFAAWAEARDLETLRALGIPASESADQRQQAYSSLMAAVALDTMPVAASPFERTVAFLGNSGSAVIAVTLEDMLGLKNQVNLPGTYKEYPNWRYRAAITWPDLRTQIERLSIILQMRRA